MKDIATVVGYMPRLDNKSPLMKVLKALTSTESEIKLELNWKRSPYWLVFIVTRCHVGCWRIVTSVST